MPGASARTVYSAFLSHAKADEKKAREIAVALEERGFKCWIAPRDVRPGHGYGDEIVRGIEKSRAFILILSNASNGSAFVAREVERAVSKGKPVYAVRVENVQPSPSLELFISGTQWIDAWSGRLSSHIEALVNLLRKKKDVVPTVEPVSEPNTEVPISNRPRWLLLGGGAAALAMIAIAAFVLKPFGVGGTNPKTSVSLADDPDYQACAKLSGDTAITFCDRAIESGKFRGPELANLYVMRGYERDQKNEAEGALADFNEAIRFDSGNVQAYTNRSRAYRLQGKFDLALKDIDEAIRIKPSSAAAFLGRGLALQANSNFDRAIEAYSEAIRLDPNYIVAIYSRGDTYRAKGDLERAKDDYQKAISLNPDSETKQQLAAKLSSLGVSTADTETDADYQGCQKLSGTAAITNCDRAIGSGGFGGKDLAELHRLRGWERRAKNDTDGAMSDYSQAIQIDPQNAEAYTNRGTLLHSRNELDLAIKDFNEAIRLNPKYSMAFWSWGNAYRSKGDIDHARKDYTEALALNPEDATKQKIKEALQELDQQSESAVQSGNEADGDDTGNQAAAPTSSPESSADQR